MGFVEILGKLSRGLVLPTTGGDACVMGSEQLELWP